MELKFNEEAKKALKELANSKENGVIRLKVLAFGWGKPALGLVLDDQRTDDFFIKVEGVPFVIEKKLTIHFENTEILYNRDIFTGGFYVHRFSTSPM